MQVKELYDPILAYRFNYPVVSVSGKQLSMIAARAPEKYSSAAPLSVRDAAGRLRILRPPPPPVPLWLRP